MSEINVSKPHEFSAHDPDFVEEFVVENTDAQQLSLNGGQDGISARLRTKLDFFDLYFLVYASLFESILLFFDQFGLDPFPNIRCQEF